LKAVLLHNGNQLPSIPIAYSAKLKESYATMDLIIQRIQYEKYSWKICGDLKVIALLLGMQLGFTKYSCFLCEWDSRARKSHYTKKHWPARQNLLSGEKNVINKPLVDPENILLPPLHIKLGLMKQFVKAMDKTSPGFLFLKQKFPTISENKIKEGIFIGPQITKIMANNEFENILSEVEGSALEGIQGRVHTISRK